MMESGRGYWHNINHIIVSKESNETLQTTKHSTADVNDCYKIVLHDKNVIIYNLLAL